MSSYFLNFTFKRNGCGLCTGHSFWQNGNRKRLINIFETSPVWYAMTCDQWILMLWYVTAETFRNDLLGCTSDWTTAQLATWQSWGGIEAQTRKEERSRKTALAQQSSALAQTNWSLKKKKFQFLNIPQWKWEALGK